MPLPSSLNVTHSFPPKMVRGDDYALEMAMVTRRAGRKLKTAVDMTGYTVTSQMRTTPGSASVVADFDVTQHPTLANVVTISLSSTTTAAIPPGEYSWDVEVDADGDISTIFQGYTISVVEDVTRA